MKCKCGLDIKVDYNWGYIVNGKRIEPKRKPLYKNKLFSPLNVLKYYHWALKQKIFWTCSANNWKLATYIRKHWKLNNKPYGI